MKFKNKAIITVIFFLIASILVIFFAFHREKPKINPVAALGNIIFSDKENKKYERSLPESNDNSLKLLFFGDLMLDRNVKTKIDKYGFDYLFATSSSGRLSFDGYDLVGANLEGAVTNGGAHYNPIMAYDFAFTSDNISQLQKHGFNFFNIANNHLADQGERGIIETGKNLQKLGLNYSGCDDKKVGECSFKILEIAGKKVGMVGLSMVYGEFNHRQADELVRQLASSTDLVIVNIHWGTEYQHQFNRLQQSIAHELIDAGADVIIGHHPHVVQGMEIYEPKHAVIKGELPFAPTNGVKDGARTNNKKGIIFYSLGNFIFDQYFSADTQEGLGVGIAVASNEIKLLLLPIKSRASQVELMAANDKGKFFQEFVGWSKLDQEQAKQILTGELTLNK